MLMVLGKHCAVTEELIGERRDPKMEESLRKPFYFTKMVTPIVPAEPGGPLVRAIRDHGKN
jgi:hypothetical protein